MNRVSRLVMLICIYATLFIGCFSLISYFNEFYLLKNPLHQLILAIVTLIIAIVLTVIMLVLKKRDSADEELEVKPSEREIPEFVLTDEEIKDDNYEFTDASEIEFIGMNEEDIFVEEEPAYEEDVAVKEETAEVFIKGEEQSAAETAVMVKEESDVSEDSIIEEEKPRDVIDVLYDTLSMKKISAEQNDEKTAEESSEQEVQITEEKPEKEEVHLEKVKQDMIVSEVVQPVELTETQMIYIEGSESSYLNTQGLPQLVITDQVASKDIKKANLIFREIEKQETLEKQQLDKEELEYLKEEKEENIISVLITAAVILGLLNIALLFYYLYTRM